MNPPKYKFQTWKSGSGFHVAVSRLVPHTYSKHTSYGQRTRLKPVAWRNLRDEDGKSIGFPTRKEAQAAAREHIKTLQTIW